MATASTEWRFRRQIETHKEGGDVCSLAVLPDGRVVSGSEFGFLQVFEPSTGKCQQTLKVCEFTIDCVISLGDGTLAAGGSNAEVVIVDTGTWEVSHRRKMGGWVKSILLLDQGQLAIANFTAGFWVWQPTSSAFLRDVPGCCCCLALLGNGTMASGGLASVNILHTDSWACLQTLELDVTDKEKKYVQALAELAGGRLAVGCFRLNDIHVFDLEDGTSTILQGHTSWITALSQLPDCTVASASMQEICVWNTTSMTCSQILEGHSDMVRCLAVLQDGALASGCKTITFWQNGSPEIPVKAAEGKSESPPHGKKTEAAASSRCAKLCSEKEALEAQCRSLKADLEAERQARGKEREELEAEKQALDIRCKELQRTLRRREAGQARALRPQHWMAAALPQGWTPQPVDVRTLELLEELCHVEQPRTLGRGHDSSEYPRAYSNLEVHCAWRIEDNALWARFNTEREIVSRQVAAVPEAQRPAFGAPRFTAVSAELPGEVRREVNEAWLLHGTRPEAVLSILSSGLNDRLASSHGAFGAGIYLAEDVEKIDQYTRPDPSSDKEGLEELHRRLFSGSGNSHPEEDLFYVFVVRAICGLQLRTTGLQRGLPDDKVPIHDEGTGDQLFLNEDRRELVTVPGVLPPVSYHSLLCETGRAIKRFREFVVLDSSRTYIEYLIAYKRV